MKSILFLAGILFTANSFAQTNALKLNKGQTITVTSSVSQNLDMGMGMSMTSSSNSTHVIKVNEESGNNYNIITTLTKVKSTNSAMGQDTKYDSEDAAASDSELAAVFEKTLNVTETSLLNKATGVATSTKVKDEDAEGDEDFLKGIMGGAATGDNSGIVSSAFFMQAAGKKVGDKWMDSSTVNGFHNTTNYTVASINGDIMTLNLDGTISGTQQIETQGMQIDVTMNTKNKGTVLLNKKTAQVIKRTVEAEVASNMDMMGQSMDMTGTIKTETEYK